MSTGRARTGQPPTLPRPDAVVHDVEDRAAGLAPARRRPTCADMTTARTYSSIAAPRRSEEFVDALRHGRRRLMIAGVLAIVLEVVAIVVPAVASVATAMAEVTLGRLPVSS